MAVTLACCDSCTVQRTITRRVPRSIPSLQTSVRWRREWPSNLSHTCLLEAAREAEPSRRTQRSRQRQVTQEQVCGGRPYPAIHYDCASVSLATKVTEVRASPSRKSLREGRCRTLAGQMSTPGQASEPFQAQHQGRPRDTDFAPPFLSRARLQSVDECKWAPDVSPRNRPPPREAAREGRPSRSPAPPSGRSRFLYDGLALGGAGGHSSRATVSGIVDDAADSGRLSAASFRVSRASRRLCTARAFLTAC